MTIGDTTLWRAGRALVDALLTVIHRGRRVATAEDRLSRSGPLHSCYILLRGEDIQGGNLLIRAAMPGEARQRARQEMASAE